MLIRLAADAVVLLHFGFIVFVALGGLLVLHRRFFLWLHPPAAVWGFLIEAKSFACPLTGFEKYLRRQAGEAGYPGGFVEHYVIPVIYPSGMTRQIQIVLAVLVVGVNVAIYGWVIWRLRQRRALLPADGHVCRGYATWVLGFGGGG